MTVFWGILAYLPGAIAFLAIMPIRLMILRVPRSLIRAISQREAPVGFRASSAGFLGAGARRCANRFREAAVLQGLEDRQSVSY
jgi:hypothetical protein